mgnify:CR=1 FL=1
MSGAKAGELEPGRRRAAGRVELDEIGTENGQHTACGRNEGRHGHVDDMDSLKGLDHFSHTQILYCDALNRMANSVKRLGCLGKEQDMPDRTLNKPAKELQIEVPSTAARALDPDWLSLALGVQVSGVEQVETIKTVATKLRLYAEHAGQGRQHCFLTGLRGTTEDGRRVGSTVVRERDS